MEKLSALESGRDECVNILVISLVIDTWLLFLRLPLESSSLNALLGLVTCRIAFPMATMEGMAYAVPNMKKNWLCQHRVQNSAYRAVRVYRPKGLYLRSMAA